MFSLGVSSEEASALLLRWLCLVQDKFCVRVPAWRAVLEELGETSSCVGAQNQLPNNNVKLLMLWHKHGKVWRCYPQKQEPRFGGSGRWGAATPAQHGAGCWRCCAAWGTSQGSESAVRSTIRKKKKHRMALKENEVNGDVAINAKFLNCSPWSIFAFSRADTKVPPAPG